MDKKIIYYLCIAIITSVLINCIILFISNKKLENKIDAMQEKVNTIDSFTSGFFHDIGSDEIIEEYENDPDVEDISIYQNNPSQQTGKIDNILSGE